MPTLIQEYMASNVHYIIITSYTRPLTAKLTSLDSSNFLALEIFLKEADLFLITTEPVRELSYRVLEGERERERKREDEARYTTILTTPPLLWRQSYQFHPPPLGVEPQKQTDVSFYGLAGLIPQPPLGS